MNTFYRVIDFYDGYDDIIGETPTLETAKALAQQRKEDTDGECNVEIFKICQTIFENSIYEKSTPIPKWKI